MRRPYISYIGEKYNHLKIVNYHKIGKGYFTCECDCGNIKDIRCDHVLNGRTISCGCKLNPEKWIDLTGRRFKKLTVIEKAYKDGYFVYWRCKCDCGNETIVYSSNLTRGVTRSCGCYKKERTKETNVIHGDTKTRLYNIYLGMKNRCYNEREPAYHSYGGRGIKVCNEWLAKETGYITFKKWALENGYSDKLTIDRIDVNGNYEPSNCRWVDVYTQANNKRTNRYFIHDGKKKTMMEWSKELGISYSTIQYRLSKHRPLIEVFGIEMKEAL